MFFLLSLYSEFSPKRERERESESERFK